MENTPGATAPDIKDIKKDLLNRSRAFSFFQVIRLLKWFCSQKTDGPHSKIKVRPNLSLAFPSSGVDKIDEGVDGTFTVTMNMMSLYGACSPLPAFYTEDLITDNANDDHSVRDLIDALNHYLYELLYKGWAKYRSMVRIAEEFDRTFVNRFCYQIGMTEEALKKRFDEPERLIRYAGLFAMNPPSATGLETLLSDAFGHIPFRVIQMTEKKRSIPDGQVGRLGVNMVLGATMLGGHYASREEEFRIEIGPVSLEDYRRFTPGCDDYRLLNSLIDLYVPQSLGYEIDILIDKTEKPGTVCLGGPCSMLGLDTWVYSGDEGPPEFRVRFYPENRAA